MKLAQRPPDAVKEYEQRRARVHAAFANPESCRYHSTEQRGKRIIYRGIEFAEFAQKAADIDRASRAPFCSTSAHLQPVGAVPTDSPPSWAQVARRGRAATSSARTAR